MKRILYDPSRPLRIRFDFHRMIATWAQLLALLLFGAAASAQVINDASTNTTTSVTCCTIRIAGETEHFDETSGQMLSVRVVVQWIRSDGSVQRSDAVAITDGDPAIASDDFLTGTGGSGTPSGYLRATLDTPAGETGSLQRRWRRRRLQWLKDNARLSDSAITLQ